MGVGLSAFRAFRWHSKVIFPLRLCTGCLQFLPFKSFVGIQKSHWRCGFVADPTELAFSLWFSNVCSQISHVYCMGLVCSGFQTFRWPLNSRTLAAVLQRLPTSSAFQLFPWHSKVALSQRFCSGPLYHLPFTFFLICAQNSQFYCMGVFSHLHSKVAFSLSSCRGCLHFLLLKRFPQI